MHAAQRRRQQLPLGAEAAQRLALQLLGHLLGRRLGEVEQARLACSARQLGRWTDAISRGSESTCQHAEPLARRGRVEQHRLDEGVGLRAARTVASGVGRGHAWRLAVHLSAALSSMSTSATMA